jgi:cysteine synthase
MGGFRDGWPIHLEVCCTTWSRMARLRELEMDPSQRVGPSQIFQVTRLIIGIGQGRVTNNLKPDIHLLSGAIHIPDSKSIAMVYRLLHEEGLYVGASSALNVVAAVELAKRKGKGSTIVTILCDGAYRSVQSIESELC